MITQSIEKKALARIYGHGRGWAFSPVDFRDVGRVDMALNRLVEAGTIRRVMRGVYDYPRFSELLQQPLAPDVHEVAQALARKFGWRIQPDGAAAMNLLGLSTQVPSQYVFLSDGPDRTYRVGETTIAFRQVALKEIGFRHHESGIIVQALKSLGEERITESVIRTIRDWLPTDERGRVLKDTERVTEWVHEAIKKICREQGTGK